MVAFSFPLAYSSCFLPFAPSPACPPQPCREDEGGSEAEGLAFCLKNYSSV